MTTFTQLCQHGITCINTDEGECIGCDLCVTMYADIESDADTESDGDYDDYDDYDYTHENQEPTLFESIVNSIADTMGHEDWEHPEVVRIVWLRRMTQFEIVGLRKGMSMLKVIVNPDVKRAFSKQVIHHIIQASNHPSRLAKHISLYDDIEEALEHW